MAKEIGKGSELSNISKTWEENERARQNDSGAASGEPLPAATGNEDLDRVIREEASEYDNTAMEDRLLDTERAQPNDGAE
jgi:hypothetical protein